MADEEDYITRRIGIIGKWQWRVLSVMLVSAALGAWQILVSINLSSTYMFNMTYDISMPSNHLIAQTFSESVDSP